jgi:hypothetical protein
MQGAVVYNGYVGVVVELYVVFWLVHTISRTLFYYRHNYHCSCLVRNEKLISPTSAPRSSHVSHSG